MSITSLSIWLVWPLYLNRVWGYSNLQVGLALTVGPISAGAMTLVAGRLADRYGHHWPIVVGTAVIVVAVVWNWQVLDEDGAYMTSFVPGIALFGFGWGLSSPTMNSFALQHVPQEKWGEVNAAFNMLRNVAGAVGISVAVAILGDRNGLDVVEAFDRTFAFFTVTVVAGFIVVVLGYPRSSDPPANA